MSDIPFAVVFLLALQTGAIIILAIKVRDLSFWHRSISGKVEMYSRHCTDRHMEMFRTVLDNDSKKNRKPARKTSSDKVSS